MIRYRFPLSGDMVVAPTSSRATSTSHALSKLKAGRMVSSVQLSRKTPQRVVSMTRASIPVFDPSKGRTPPPAPPPEVPQVDPKTAALPPPPPTDTDPKLPPAPTPSPLPPPPSFSSPSGGGGGGGGAAYDPGESSSEEFVLTAPMDLPEVPAEPTKGKSKKPLLLLAGVGLVAYLVLKK